MRMPINILRDNIERTINSAYIVVFFFLLLRIKRLNASISRLIEFERYLERDEVLLYAGYRGDFAVGEYFFGAFTNAVPLLGLWFRCVV